MNAPRFTSPYADEAIVAWLDGEMRAEDAQAFETELKRSETLSARTAELMKSNQPFADAFAPMLDDAPRERMESRLAYLLQNTPSAPAKAVVQVSRRALISASVSFLLVGSGIGFWARPRPAATTEQGESAHIRELEAQYMSLYSPETLADVDSSPQVLARSLQRTARDLDLHLTAEQLALPEASLKSVRMLRYDDSLITQIAWNHSNYGPMALCISRDEHAQQSELAQEKRHGMNLVWWHRSSYQYVLIGRNPADQLKRAAQVLNAALV